MIESIVVIILFLVVVFMMSVYAPGGLSGYKLIILC